MPSLAWHSNGSFFQRSSYENYVHYFIKSGGPYLYTKEAEHLLFGCQSLSRCWLAECWLLWLTAPSWHHFFFFSGNGYQSLLRSLFKTRMEKPEPASLWMQPGLYFTFFFFFFFFLKNTFYPHGSTSDTSRPTRELWESFLQLIPASFAFHSQWTQNSGVSTTSSPPSVSLTFRQSQLLPRSN